MSEVQVCLTLYGEVHRFQMPRDDTTVLEAARLAGIDWPTQCEVGICGTCRSRLLSGTVSMRDNMVLDDAEVAAGFVLCCQAVPDSDEISLELDES